MQVIKVGLPFLNINKQDPKIQSAQHFGVKMASPIKHDTVNFGAAKNAVFADFIEQSVAKDEPRMRRIATIFLDVLESIAKKLESSGVSIDRPYCEKNLLKTPTSYVSKIVRSKNFKVPDQIRATIYCKNLYDLSILNDQILPELAIRGYKIADTAIPIENLMQKGYVPKKQELEKGYAHLPDLDIRLDAVSDQITKLASSLKYSISKPQASGYEDVQMRLVRDTDNKKNPVLHELLILFGENYANAKHHESERIYKYARQFGEMNILKSEKSNEKIDLAKRYITLIKKFLSTEISERAFENAKNLDIYDIKDMIPIKVTANGIKTLTSYFDELEKQICDYYKNEIANTKSKKIRDILARQRREDRARFAEIKENLFKSIEFYNKQGHTKIEIKK